MTRWFVRNRKRFINIQLSITHFKEPIVNLIKYLKNRMSQAHDNDYHRHVENYITKNRLPYSYNKIKYPKKQRR